MKAWLERSWRGAALGLGLLAASAGAGAHDFGSRIEHRMDRKGDRIDHRLDRRAAHAAAYGHYNKAYLLDRKGDRIDARLDRRGRLADARWDRRGKRFERRWDHHSGHGH